MAPALGPPGRKRVVMAVGALVLLAALMATLFVRVQVDGPPLVAVPHHRAGTTATYVAFWNGSPAGALALALDETDSFAGPQGAIRPGYQIRVNITSEETERHHTEWVTAEGARMRNDLGDRRPGFEETRGAFEVGEPLVPDLDVVGDALRPAAPLASPGHGSWTWWTMEDGAPVLEQMLCEATNRSTDAGRLDGEPAVAVQTTFLCEGHERVRTSWFTAGASLPQVVRFDGPEPGGSLVLALHRYVRGAGAEVPSTEHRDGSGPPILRFGPTGASHPTTGDRLLLPLPLEEAMRQVESSPETGLFRLWQARHPDADLVGALLLRGEHHWRERPTDQWRLLYATDEAGYLVGVERQRDGSRTWVSDRGEVSLAADVAAPPDRLLTVESAGALWKQAAAMEHRDGPMDYVHWGMDVPLRWSEECEFEPPRTGLIPQDPGPARFVVGRSTFGSCTDPKVVRAESYVVVDAERGRLEQIVEHRVELARFPDGTVPRGASVAAISGPAPLSVAYPEIEPIAAVTVPLLFLLWALYFWPLLKLGAVRMYARVLPSAAPEHPVRARILETVAADEGLSASDLVARAEVGWGALTHHAALLEKGGFIRTCVVGRTRHFFTAETARSRSIEAIALLRHPASRGALDAITRRPGLTQRQLAEALGMTPAGALWHVRRLQDAGLIRRQRQGRYVTYYRSEPAV